MKINKHIQELEYPEYANLTFKTVDVNLAQHGGRESKYSYTRAQDKTLIDRIARFENLKAENILITAGADGALHHVAETFLYQRKLAVIPIPTFGRFEFHTKIVGAKAIFVKHNKFPYSFDLKKITQVAKEKHADLIFLANPNNPTGDLIGKGVLKKFIRANRNCTVLIDEALIEETKDSCSEFVNAFQNLIVVKSFSKFLGVPGLRIGYVLGNRQLIRTLAKTVSPYEVSSLSLITAKKLLLDREYTNKRQKELKQVREYLKKKLRLPFSKTQAAVVLIDGDKKSVSLFEHLFKGGTLTVSGNNFRGLEKTNTVRIVINDARTIEKFVQVANNYI